MSQERPPSLIDGEEAYEIWRAVLSAYEGEFSESEHFAHEFKGKGSKGAFWVTFAARETHISVGADLSESGFGFPCVTLKQIREATEEATRFCGMKRKDFEQLRLW